MANSLSQICTHEICFFSQNFEFVRTNLLGLQACRLQMACTVLSLILISYKFASKIKVRKILKMFLIIFLSLRILLLV